MKINNNRLDILEKIDYKEKTWLMVLSSIGGALVAIVGKIGFIKLLTLIK